MDWVKVRLNKGYREVFGGKAIRIENLLGIPDTGWPRGESAFHSKFRDLEYDPRKNLLMPCLRIFAIMDTQYEISRSDRSYIAGNRFGGVSASSGTVTRRFFTFRNPASSR
ncbi:MAG: hypothetical protein IJT54_05645 [Candidatus Methanomethylophilaceae archaeon]|nr:hypothetical protein [Candidatus Methanomethylophilaceae archaeon]